MALPTTTPTARTATSGGSLLGICGLAALQIAGALSSEVHTLSGHYLDPNLYSLVMLASTAALAYLLYTFHLASKQDVDQAVQDAMNAATTNVFHVNTLNHTYVLPAEAAAVSPTVLHAEPIMTPAPMPGPATPPAPAVAPVAQIANPQEQVAPPVQAAP